MIAPFPYKGLTLILVINVILLLFNPVYSISSGSLAVNPRDASTFMPKEERLVYEKENENLHAFIKRSIPEMLKHTGALAFDDHLKGVQTVLRYWEQPTYLCNAGLVHSIYGTQGFQGFKLPFTSRQQVQDLVGKEAERIAFIFCVIDRETLDVLVERYHTRLMKLVEDNVEENSLANAFQDIEYKVKARLELGHFDIEFVDEKEFLDFVTLTLADWMEQVEGAATKENPGYGWQIGQAYGHRRIAFGKMKDILVHRLGLQKASEFYEEVMATESDETKSYHQPVTPPLSEAAEEALLAYTSYHQLCK